MKELPFPDNMNNTKELGFLDKNGNTVEIYIGSGGSNQYDDEGVLEWWVVSNWWDDKPLRPNQEAEVKQFLNDYLRHHGVPKYELFWRNRYDDEDGDESDVFITLNPLPAAEEKLWLSLWENKSRKPKSCSHEDLSIKTMEVLNGELLLTLVCDKCGKRTSTSASLNQGWEAEDLNTWAKQELSSHGQNVSFKNWAKKEVKSHGNIDLVDWAKHEKQSHTKKYGAEYENIGTMSVAPARGYNGYMNMMSSARRMVEIGNETGLDQKLGEAYQDESGRWFLPILERKASESFSLDSKKADSINMEEPMVEEPSFIPDGDGRAIGQQNSSINLSPLHAETFEEEYECHWCGKDVKKGDKFYFVDGAWSTDALCVSCKEAGDDEDADWGKLNIEDGTWDAEGDSATYSPSDEPDMVNEIQTSPTNESPQLFNASNTFNTTTALGIGGLVVAALSLPMLYSSAKSRLGKSAEEKRKSNGSVRKNHTQVKNSEYSVGQVNPVEAEGQQDIHGAEGITNPRHSPSPTPSGYPSKNLKMW
jgi:hypothetical protein